MKNHRRRALAAIPLLGAVMLLCFSSVTWAEEYGVTDVTIWQVWGDGIGKPLARPGGKVWVSADVTKKGIKCKVYMGIKIGNTERDLEWVGAINWDGEGTSTMTWPYTLGSGESDGVKDVTVTVRAMDIPTSKWYGPPMSVTRQSGFTVDGTGPAFGTWDPAGRIVDQTSCVFTVPLGDGAGVDWTKLTSESVAVFGGALYSVECQGDAARVSVVSMNQAGTKSIKLTAWDSLGNSSTGWHNFTVADTIPPRMGEWVVDGVVVDDGVRILQNSPSFMMHITDDYPTSGIDAGSGVVFSVWDGEKYHRKDAHATAQGDQYIAQLFWLPDGDYSLTFKATDGSGNRSSSALNFTIDTVQPQFSNPDPTHGFETNNRYITPTILITDPAGRLSPDSTVWRMKDPDSLDVSGQATWSDPVSRFTPGSAAAPAPLIKDGIYSLEVCAQDEVGHRPVYPPSGAWQFLLDTTSPVVDSIEPNVYRRIGGRVYTGRNGTDGKDLELTVTVSDPGPNPSGFNVRGTLDVEVYGSTDTLIPGRVSCDPSPRPDCNTDPWTATWKSAAVLPDGVYYVKVLATDDAGNTLTSKSFEFIVDTTPPDIEGNRAEVGLLNNTNNRRFANSRQVQVKWDRASDPSAGSAPGSGLLGYWFEIWTKNDGWTYDDGQGVKLYEAWTDTDSYPLLVPPLNYLRPTGSSTEIWNGGPLGLESGKSYGAWIRAWDMLHNASTWFDPPFIFDADAPADPGAPEVKGLKNPVTDRRTNDNTPALKWAHSTDEKAWAQSGVDLYEVQMAEAVAAPQSTIWDIYHRIDIPDEDVDKQLTDAPLAGDFECTVSTPLADGKYVVRVRAKDVAGNYSSWAEIAAPFTIDTQAPAAPGMPKTTCLTNAAEQVWTWNGVTDADLDRYEIMIDGVLADPVLTPDPARSATYTTSLDEGVHFLQVRAVDDLGNTSLWSEKGYATIDRTAPAAPVMRALPPFTNAVQLTFEWSASFDAAGYELSYSRDAGASWTEADFAGVKSDPVDIRDVSDGVAVLVRVRAYDAAGNMSSWSDELPGALIESTVVDRIGPRVTMTSPTEPVATNASAFTWTWMGVDDGSGVQGYMISLDGVSWLALEGGASYIGKLCEGDNMLWVKGVDRLGNVSVDAAEAAVVTRVVPQIATVEPIPGATEYTINDISTIAFQVVGLHEAAIEVRVNKNLLEPWRIVTLMDTPTLAKFYVLLDGAVMQPGPLTVTIKIGDVTRYCDYSVLNERSGFGFGRLRPW